MLKSDSVKDSYKNQKIVLKKLVYAKGNQNDKDHMMKINLFINLAIKLAIIKVYDEE